MKANDKKAVHKKLTNFAEKNPGWSLFLPKFFKTRLYHRCFPVEFSKILRTPILKNICE